jgi:MFS family permease
MHDPNADTGAAPNRGSPDGWDPNTTTLQDGAVSIDSSGFADWDETDPGHPYNWYMGSRVFASPVVLVVVLPAKRRLPRALQVGGLAWLTLLIRPRWRKVLHIFLTTMLTLSIRFGLGMIAPSIPTLMEMYNPDNDPDLIKDDAPLKFEVFAVSVYVLGLAAGPLLMAPLSHLYGRRVVNFATGLGFGVFTAACAFTQPVGALICARFFAGVYGCGALINGPGSIADLWPEEERNRAQMVYSSGSMLGLVIGPLAGGYMVDAMGMPKALWIYGAAVSGLAMAVVLSGETYAPVLLQRKVNRLRDIHLLTRLDIDRVDTGEIFRRHFIGPLKLCFDSANCAAYAMLTGIAYGYHNSVVSHMSYAVRDMRISLHGLERGETVPRDGSHFLYFNIGCLLALPIIEAIGPVGKDASWRSFWRRFMIGTSLAIIGLFVYGWALESEIVRKTKLGVKEAIDEEIRLASVLVYTGLCFM